MFETLTYSFYIKVICIAISKSYKVKFTGLFRNLVRLLRLCNYNM